jgi:ribosomal protein S18 acetylase RimI-like enzyme
MTIQEWRTCSPAEVAPLLAAEIRAWRRELDWDISEAWRVVEPARRAGSLPGVVVRDAAGGIAGWSAYLVHGRSLQVLAFVAPDAGVAAALVEAILASPESRTATSSLFSVRDGAPGLVPLLTALGFAVEPYRYLCLPLRPSRVDLDGARGWHDDTERMARLCARAYAGSAEVRAFAPNGTMAEWREYIASLVKGPGCGVFLPELSLVAPAAAEDFVAAVCVTDLGPATVHVAQIAVDPAARGRGWGRRLIGAVAAAARPRGYSQMTLLVSASNRPAVAMYEQLGFRDQARFVVATRAQPIRSTSEAVVTGGDSTRR